MKKTTLTRKEANDEEYARHKNGETIRDPHISIYYLQKFPTIGDLKEGKPRTHIINCPSDLESFLPTPDNIPATQKEKNMKWEEISEPIHQAASDTTEAINIAPSYRNGEKEELDQSTIDRLYNLLGTSILNAKSAMAKLQPHTTYFKDSLAENAKKDVRISINDPNNSVSLFDLNRKNIYGEDYCVAPDILEKQVDQFWDRYIQQLREEDWENLVAKKEKEKNET